MENNFLTSLLLYTCIPVVTFVGGGIIATYKKRLPLLEALFYILQQV